MTGPRDPDGHGEPVADDEEEVRALVVDDHKLFAESLAWALQQRGMTVVGVAVEAEEAMRLLRETRPNLVLLDLGIPGGGIELGRRMLEELPETKVLVVTALRRQRALREALDAGFHGYLTKDIPITRFADAVRAVIGGQLVAPQRLVRETARGRPTKEQLLARQLTEREREVLALLAEGAATDKIAARLGITRNTVRTHAQSILTKLQVHSRLEAAAFGIRHGLVDVPKPREE